MAMRRVAAITIVGASLLLAGCGDSRSVPAGGAPSVEEIASCLEDGGAVETQIKEDSDFEGVIAPGVAGDVILVLNLPEPGLIERATHMFRKEFRKEGLHGIMTTAAFNGGFTFTAVLGREGLNAGMPSIASEALAKLCATRPPRRGP